LSHFLAQIFSTLLMKRWFEVQVRRRNEKVEGKIRIKLA